MSIDLFAEFESSMVPRDGIVEIDLEYTPNYEEAEKEAREELEIDDDDPIELNSVNVYADDSDAQALADEIHWDELFSEGKDEVIAEFLALDKYEQINALVSREYHGVSLEQAMGELDRMTFIHAESEDRLFDDWLEAPGATFPDQFIYYLDREKIIKDHYHIMSVLVSGRIVATYK